MSCRQGSNAVGGGCTTQRQNTHRSERREVFYLWHPWAGDIVQVHEVVEKASGDAARCSRGGEEADRLLELPTWMFDRAVCAPMRMDTRPWVDVATLEALTTLLAEAVVTAAAPSNAPVSGAQTVSGDENRGDHDAVPAQGALRPTSEDETVRSVRPTRRQGNAGADMGRTSRGDTPNADTPDRAVDPRSRRRRSRSRGGAR